MACLRRNGYYRLSAYWYPFREIINGTRTNTFLENSHFEDAKSLYIFDKEIKLILLDAIERLEIAVRAEIASVLGCYDTFAHTNPRLLHRWFNEPNLRRNGIVPFEEWTARYNDMVSRSKDEFVKHHWRIYGRESPLPIWIAIELWDFGLTSRFYSGMRVRDRQVISERFAVPDWQVMESWLRTLNYVRNVIAHHGRLWNLDIVEKPILPRHDAMSAFAPLRHIANVESRIYSISCILAHFSHVINPDSKWTIRFADKIRSFPAMPHARIGDMGFPSDWYTHDFWQ